MQVAGTAYKIRGTSCNWNFSPWVRILVKVRRHRDPMRVFCITLIDYLHDYLHDTITIVLTETYHYDSINRNRKYVDMSYLVGRLHCALQPCECWQTLNFHLDLVMIFLSSAVAFAKGLGSVYCAQHPTLKTVMLKL